MQITLNIVLECIGKYNFEVNLDTAISKRFTGVCLLPQTKEDLSSDKLYVGTLTEVMHLRQGDQSICCVCLRDRVKDAAETSELLSGTVVVNENIKLSVLFMDIQNEFIRLNDWISAMNQCVIKNKGPQNVLDLSENIIGNFIAFTDSALMLIAYTQHIPCDDPMSIAMIKSGYHPDKNIEIFRRSNMFEKWEKSDSIMIDDSLAMTLHPTVAKIFKFRNVYFSHVVMTCNYRKITPGLIDLFQYLIDVLAIYAERDWKKKDEFSHIYDSLVADLIDGNVTGREAIAERAKFVNLPLSGLFTVYRILPCQSAKFSIGRMAQELTSLLPGIKVIIYHQQIIALSNFTANNFSKQSAQLKDTLEKFLEKYDSLCGISARFENLTDMRFAYIQASLTLDYYDKYKGSDLFTDYQDEKTNENRIILFEDDYIYYLLGENEQNAQLWEKCTLGAALRKLYDYDCQHNTNNLQLLYTHLLCERRATDTGLIMHMHRNNVLYRIGKIEEMMGFDLNDHRTRLKLMVSYALLKLYGFSDSAF